MIYGTFSTKNKPIIIENYYIPIEESKYEAKFYNVMFYSSYDIHCAISIDNKETNKMYENPAEMMSEKKSLVLMYEWEQFEQLICSLT